MVAMVDGLLAVKRCEGRMVCHGRAFGWFKGGTKGESNRGGGNRTSIRDFAQLVMACDFCR